MKTLTVIVIALIIMGVFTSYGWFEAFQAPGYFDHDAALYGMLFCGSLGFAISSSSVSAFCAIRGVLAQWLSKFEGMVILFAGSILAAALPPIALRISGSYQGEPAITLGVIALLTSGISLVGFVLSSLGILLFAPRTVNELK